MSDALDLAGGIVAEAATANRKTLGRASLVFGALALIAACFMPFVVAWDDSRALEKWQQSEPVEIFGFRLGSDEFVPPSDKGEMGPCVMLFMMAITLSGLAALILGIIAILRLSLWTGFLGSAMGIGGVLLAAWLSPMGLMVLGVIAICMLLASLGAGLSGAGASC